jgi:hypothetical protein
MKRVFILIALLFFLAAPLWAQETGGKTPSPGEILSDMFNSLVALAVGVILITEFLKQKIHVKGFALKLLSWIVSIVLSLLGFWMEIGLFAEPLLWYQVMLIGLGAGLIANGIASADMVKQLLIWIGVYKSPNRRIARDGR